MVAADGSPDGVSVALANALGEHLGRPVLIENTAFDGLIPALKTGKIDLIISSMTATEERARSIDFSDPYLRTGLCLLVGKNSSVQSAADLNARDRKIAVKKGTTGHLHAMKEFSEAQLVVLDKENACVLEVIQGKADAFIYDQMSVFQHAKRNPDTTRAILTPFKEESWAVGLRKGDDALRGHVNEFLAKFKADGGFDKLGDRYLAEQKAAFKEQGIPFLF
jgi:polar amino acid transport system substrate-binding protein